MAAPLLRLHSILPSADEDGLAVDQSLSDFATTACKHPSDRLSRDAHGFGGLLMAETLQIHEPDGLQLVDSEFEAFEVSRRNARRLEQRDARNSRNGTLNRGSRHAVPPRQVVGGK
jgi:hypothetical protein